MDIGIIIQARLGSTRLPGKTLMPLGSKTVLEQIIHRLSYFLPVKQIIVATTQDIKDKLIIDLCQTKNIPYFVGSQEDVLERYYQTAKHYSLEHIIRICADSPIIDPILLEQMYQKYKEGDWDYLSNTLEDTFPEGLNAEFFSFKSLQQAYEKAQLPSEREHVTPYIKKNSQFKKYSYVSAINYSSKRWTLDYQKDYELIIKIYQYLEHIQPFFTTQDVLNILYQYPELEKINQNITRNEGYLKSLKEDEQQEKTNGDIF